LALFSCNGCATLGKGPKTRSPIGRLIWLILGARSQKVASNQNAIIGFECAKALSFPAALYTLSFLFECMISDDHICIICKFSSFTEVFFSIYCNLLNRSVLRNPSIDQVWNWFNVILRKSLILKTFSNNSIICINASIRRNRRTYVLPCMIV